MVWPSFARIPPVAGDPLKWIECPLELMTLPLPIMKQIGKSLVCCGELKGEETPCLLSRAAIQNKADNVKEPSVGYGAQIEKSASGKGFRASEASQTLTQFPRELGIEREHFLLVRCYTKTRED